MMRILMEPVQNFRTANPLEYQENNYHNNPDHRQCHNYACWIEGRIIVAPTLFCHIGLWLNNRARAYKEPAIALLADYFIAPNARGFKVADIPLAITALLHRLPLYAMQSWRHHLSRLATRQVGVL